jgi:hypothetical protein
MRSDIARTAASEPKAVRGLRRSHAAMTHVRTCRIKGNASVTDFFTQMLALLGIGLLVWAIVGLFPQRAG